MSRGSHESTGSSTTREPAGRSGRSSRVSPTTSCPGTNGIDDTEEKYGDERPVSNPMSDPQMPDSRGATRVQPSPGTTGAARLISRNGDMLPATIADSRLPALVDVTVREAR